MTEEEDHHFFTSDDHQCLIKPLGEKLMGNFVMDGSG